METVWKSCAVLELPRGRTGMPQAAWATNVFGGVADDLDGSPGAETVAFGLDGLDRGIEAVQTN
jgi:hypothetical protein